MDNGSMDKERATESIPINTIAVNSLASGKRINLYLENGDITTKRNLSGRLTIINQREREYFRFCQEIKTMVSTKTGSGNLKPRCSVNADILVLGPVPETTKTFAFCWSIAIALCDIFKY